MSDRDGIFAGTDPFEIVGRWMQDAEPLELNDPNAMALATVDDAGMPNVRVVLLKGIEADAFVFYTNYESKKAEELEGAGKAAFAIHWKSLRRQIRARGLISKEDGPLADDYFASRSLKSRLGAWASAQSRPLESRAALQSKLEEITAEHGDNPSRPPNWGGYRLRPLEIEFWADGPHRLHDRFRWTRIDVSSAWSTQRLNP